jgi:hypothetical protein
MIKKNNLMVELTGKYSLMGTFPLILYFLLFNSNNMRIINLVDLSDGTYVKYYSIDNEEFNLLMNDVEDFSIDEYGLEVYKMKNGEVIRHLPKWYELYQCYESYTEMRRLIEDFPKRKDRHHFFEGYNTYKKEFPNKTKELIQKLFEDLGLNSENIVIDNTLINKVDKAVSYQEDPQIFMITHILEIVALVGEVFISEHSDAEWHIERDADGETWMPMIKMKRATGQQGTISFVLWLYEDMMFFDGIFDVLDSSYSSLGDFGRLNLLTPEKGSESKLNNIDGKIIKD